MKTIISVLIIGFTIFNLQAQDYEEVGDRVKQSVEKPSDLKTVFKGQSSIQGFGSLDLGVTEIKGKTALMPGFKGGVILNRHLILGIGGYGIANSVSYKRSSDDKQLYLYGGYGGLVVGGIIAPNELIHVSFPVLFGVGGIHSSSENYFRYPSDNTIAEEEATTVILVIEPAAEMEVNVSRFFRLGIGASYRIVGNSEIVEVSNKSLSGLSANISLKFGSFR